MPEPRVALITGGKRIGQTVAAALAHDGVDIGLSYRTSLAEAEQTIAIVQAAGRRAVAFQADLGHADQAERLVAETVRALGRLDILVLMASIYRNVPIEELSADAWHEDLAANLTSAFLCARAAVPHLAASGRGRIITFADWTAASHRPRYPGYLSYYVAKAGVIALTEALALELAPRRILVNAIAPGPIAPPEGMTEEEREAVERATPLGRWGGHDEIARAVISLVDNNFITGETIRVDGGRHVR